MFVNHILGVLNESLNYSWRIEHHTREQERNVQVLLVISAQQVTIITGEVSSQIMILQMRFLFNLFIL